MRRLLLTALFVGPLLGAPLAARAQYEVSESEWRKSTRLYSQEGVEIGLDYRVRDEMYYSNKPSRSFYLAPVEVNVSGAMLKAGDAVQLVFINYMRNFGECGSRSYDWKQVARVDLKRAPEGHYYGSLTQDGVMKEWDSERFTQPVQKLALVLGNYCNTQKSLYQEVAVVVNGQWLTQKKVRAEDATVTNFRLDLKP